MDTEVWGDEALIDVIDVESKYYLSPRQGSERTRRWKSWIRIIREPLKLVSFRSRTSRLLIPNLFFLDTTAQWQDWKFFDASDTLNRIATSNGDCGYSSGFLVIPESGSNLQAHYRITNVITYLSFKTPINSMILVLVFSRLFEIGFARGLTTESLWCFSFESSWSPEGLGKMGSQAETIRARWTFLRLRDERSTLDQHK